MFRSLGKAPNSIDRKTSIEHGVKVICNLLNHEKIKVSSPQDLEHIKIALQAYNYGSGYITYINDTSGFGRDTTKEQDRKSGKVEHKAMHLLNQKKMSAQLNGGVAKKRTGSSADILGPYAYGDAYYVSHVLRYYSADGIDGVSVKGGEAAKVKYEDKQKFIWEGASVPKNQSEVSKYLVPITVKIYDEKGKSTTMTLTVHKKLAEEFKGSI